MRYAARSPEIHRGHQRYVGVQPVCVGVQALSRCGFDRSEVTSSESHKISVILLTRRTVVRPMKSGRST